MIKFWWLIGSGFRVRGILKSSRKDASYCFQTKIECLLDLKHLFFSSGRTPRTRPTPTTSTTCTPTSPYSTSSGTQPHTHVFQGMGVRVYTIFLFFPIFSNFNTLFIMVSAIFIVETVKSLSILCMSC